MFGRVKLGNTCLTYDQGNFNQIAWWEPESNLNQNSETRALPLWHQRPKILVYCCATTVYWKGLTKLQPKSLTQQGSRLVADFTGMNVDERQKIS